MSNYLTSEDPPRQASPDPEHLKIQRIEVEFAIPVYVPLGFQRELDGLLSALTRLKVNQPKDGVHWVAGVGAKMDWSQRDARLLGKVPADDAPLSGEPTFDDSVLSFETCAREAYPKERT